MTLKQLEYIVTAAKLGNITEAANKLFLSQPSLTHAILELEKEMGITIFNRKNKGITVTKEGEEFLGYARQVLEQANLLTERSSGRPLQRKFQGQHNFFCKLPALLFCCKCFR